MYAGLYGDVSSLPGDTLLCCGHEYTLANLEFAATIEPGNPHLARKRAWASHMRANGWPTVPSTLGEERTYNPFLRVHQPDLCRAVGGDALAETAFDREAGIALLAELRQRKDHF